jgi:Zn finger protein HypA/HybF involved in hydrogenase expression
VMGKKRLIRQITKCKHCKREYTILITMDACPGCKEKLDEVVLVYGDKIILKEKFDDR